MNRNLILHENQGWCIEQSNYKIFSILEQFNKETLIGIQMNKDVDENISDRIDIFCDGARFHLHKNGGFSAVAMKQNWIMFCSAKHLDVCNSTLEAEVKGIVLGWKLANQNKCALTVLHSYSTKAI